MRKRNSLEKRSITFEQETLTEQNHRDSVDVHNIIKQYQTTGMVTHLNNAAAQYADLATMPDFQEAQNIIAQAKSTFEQIPSHIRAKFKNDPALFLGFIENPENRDQMIELGLDTSHFPDLEVSQPTEQPLTSHSETSENPENPENTPDA